MSFLPDGLRYSHATSNSTKYYVHVHVYVHCECVLFLRYFIVFHLKGGMNKGDLKCKMLQELKVVSCDCAEGNGKDVYWLFPEYYRHVFKTMF